MRLIRSFIFAFLALFTTVMQAAPVTVLLDAEVFGGDFDGATATGTLTYDDADIVDDFINAADGLEVEFIFFGQTFTESDDVDFDGQPSLVFNDVGEITAFDWVVSEVEGNVLTDIDEPGIFDFSMFGVSQDGTGPGGEILISGELFVNDFTVVPLPVALHLFVAGLGLIGLSHRR